MGFYGPLLYLYKEHEGAMIPATIAGPIVQAPVLVML